MAVAKDSYVALLSPHFNIVVALSGLRGAVDRGRENGVREGVALAFACTAFTEGS